MCSPSSIHNNQRIVTNRLIALKHNCVHTHDSLILLLSSRVYSRGATNDGDNWLASDRPSESDSSGPGLYSATSLGTIKQGLSPPSCTFPSSHQLLTCASLSLSLVLLICTRRTTDRRHDVMFEWRFLSNQIPEIASKIDHHKYANPIEKEREVGGVQTLTGLKFKFLLQLPHPFSWLIRALFDNKSTRLLEPIPTRIQQQ